VCVCVRVLCAWTIECVCVVHVDDRVCACCVRGREYLLLYVCSVSVADPSIRPTGRRGAEHEKKVL
jgi:hypothetical protein